MFPINFRKTLINLPRRHKQVIAIAADIVMSVAAMWLAFSLRLDTNHVPTDYEWVPYGLAIFLFIPFFVRFGLYRAIFRYSGVSSLRATATAIFFYGGLLFLILFVAKFPSVPRSMGILQPILFFSLVFGSRVITSQLLIRVNRGKATIRNVLIYGAGQAGAQVSEALSMSPEYRVRGFLDDDPAKHNRSVHGRAIYDPARTAEVVGRFDISDILIALPSAGIKRRREIIDSLAKLQVRVRTIPGFADLARGVAHVDDIQELQIIDLLQRAPIITEFEKDAMARKTILITGAGGSIGSELCRQILAMRPAELLLLDHNEFGLYSIDDELRAVARQNGIETKLLPCLGSIRDKRRVTAIFERYKPHFVYHAAAYKHVPLVEANPIEAAHNNIIGTAIVARAAAETGSERFTLISTDKAVRPTNFMGASKRLAEQVVQALSAVPGQTTTFSMVRFGNVLGSSGSVVPLFRRQIAAGGPVTITHPEVTRYFMTIPEAVGLVLQSSQMAQGGEVFVLDMGEPVKIIDLARKMIRLSGQVERAEETPDGDIAIEVTGLRPGEKLYEELLIGNNPQRTSNSHIMKALENFLSQDDLERELQLVEEAIERQNTELLAEVLTRTVDGFRRDGDRRELLAQECGAEDYEAREENARVRRIS